MHLEVGKISENCRSSSFSGSSLERRNVGQRGVPHRDQWACRTGSVALKGMPPLWGWSLPAGPTGGHFVELIFMVSVLIFWGSFTIFRKVQVRLADFSFFAVGPFGQAQKRGSPRLWVRRPLAFRLPGAHLAVALLKLCAVGCSLFLRGSFQLVLNLGRKDFGEKSGRERPPFRVWAEKDGPSRSQPCET